MNPQETEQVVARDEGWVPAAERVKIIPMNVRLETTVKQKEETFQVVIDVIKNSTCFKAFTISVDPTKSVWLMLKSLGRYLISVQEKKGEEVKARKYAISSIHQAIIDYFLSKLKSLKKLKFQHLHTIKDDSVVSRLKFVRICEAVQQFGLANPTTMLNINIIESETYQKFHLYSTGSIPPKKSRGKGSLGKKTGDTIKETVKVTEESDPKPLIRKKTSCRRVTKKEATISAVDNIIHDPDLALELGKSISLTEAKEEATAREVHATHEKIVSQAVLEPTRRRQIWVTIRDTSSISKKKTLDSPKKLKGFLTLTPAEQEAADIMKALKESRKTSKRQSGTGGSDEGTGVIPGVPNESIIVFTTLSKGTGTKLGVPDEEEIIYKDGADEIRKHSDKDANAEDDDEETKSNSEDIYKYKIKVRKDADVEMKDAETVKEKKELTDDEKTAELTKEITEQPLTSPSLYVSFDYGSQFLNLSQDEETFEKPPVTSTTSELQQTTPIPTTILTPPINIEAPSIPEITLLIASQVPIIVDKYLGTKPNDALFKALKRHTVNLIKKYSRLPAPESSKKQESEKSVEEIIRIKREQDEKKQMPTYTIKSTDTATLKEFDLKRALFKAMHENKFANRNLANYRLYHALIEALIEDENAMDKDVEDTVKDHKRKHDSDDDDEGPSAGTNQGKTSNKRRTRESESAKKSSTTKETSKGKALKKDSKTGKSAPAEEPVEESTKEVSMDEQPTKKIPSPDDMHVTDPEDTDNSHIPKVPTTTTWFRALPEEERPALPELEWVIPLSDLPEANNNWADALAKTYQDPDENKLHNKTGDIGSFIKWYCRRIGKDKLIKADFEGPAFMMVELVNLEGHWIVLDISKPLPLGGPSGQYDISAAYGITHRWFRRKEFYINNHRVSFDPHIVRSYMRILSVISIKSYERYGYNHLNEIIIRRADYNKYKISEKDFKNLHPNDFEDLNILHLQGKLDYLPKQDKVHLYTVVDLWTRNTVIRKHVEDLQLGIESYQTKLNLEQPNWDASDFLFKEDYTIVYKPRAVIYRDKNE
nr:hypothetical protein [Tanacetum cinerariifolium]